MNDVTSDFDPNASLRIMFGLKAITNEPNPPPVDTELLEKLWSKDGIDKDSFELAMGFLEKYETWRDALRAMAKFNRKSPVILGHMPTGS